MDIGYTKDLFILPFDHRSSFIKKMFGIEDREPTEGETEKVEEVKEIIYEGYKKALSGGMPKDSCAILLDEQFGDELLHDAHENGYTIILTVEKSGTDEFHFEYGDEFIEHIKKYKPTFIKALIHYNPEGNHELNARQRDRLHVLSHFSHESGYKFLIEPLIPPTVEQLAKFGGDPDRYDKDLRPFLTIQMMKELQEAKIEPDVWKIEGMNRQEDYQMAIGQAKSDGRDEVGIVVLGKAAESSVVENWLKVGAKVRGVIGFAIGRTIFWDPIMQFEEGRIGEDEASEIISKRFLHYYHVFIESRQGL